MNVETVSEQLLFSTLRLETQEGIGTGFIVSHKWGPEKEGYFFVTNKHVIADNDQGRITLTLAEESDGTRTPKLGVTHNVSIKDKGWLWIDHPSPEVDISVMPYTPLVSFLNSTGVTPYFRSVPTSFFPDDNTLERFDVVEDVLFVGYPSGMFDESNNLPIFRRGVTATHPHIEYNDMPITLIDASVFPGSSGSPVFVRRTGPWFEDGDRSRRSEQYFLLGILSKVFFRRDDGQLAFEEVPTAVTPKFKSVQMIDLGMVYKSRAILETINHALRQFGQVDADDSGQST